MNYDLSYSFLPQNGATSSFLPTERLDKSKLERIPSVPLDKKVLLTIREAAEYFNIGQNKISALLLEDGCPFVLFVGTKKLVKRKKFEDYLDNRFSI
ncbi:MAG: excisionase [Faecalibacterium sp.]